MAVPMDQLLIAVIERDVDGNTIPQRAADGYVNATAICKASGKNFADYRRNSTTQEFLAELERSMGIPMDLLEFTTNTGPNRDRGTWVHPHVAINLGQWCSPKFAVAISKWVHEWMSGKIVGAKMPYHLERYLANREAIPPTHWSMLSEMTFLLVAPLEDQGYSIPENLLPDISEGLMFCRWLRDELGVDTNALKKYKHVYNNGRVVEANLYPNCYLEPFRKHFHSVWMMERAKDFFEDRDAKALQYLPKLIEHSEQTLENYQRKLL